MQVIVFKVAAPIVAGIVLLAMGYTTIAIILFVAGAIVFIVFAIFWSTIKLVARLFKV